MDLSDTNVLVVDDDASNLDSLRLIFEREGARVMTASNGTDALASCRKSAADVVLTDLMMPGMSGNELVQALQTVSPETEIVVMTAYGTIETAVEAIRLGAYDFIEKPLKRARIVRAVRKAAEHRALMRENRALKQQLSAFKERVIVGSSPIMRQVLDLAAQAAPSVANVLVLGESGTGKELLARWIHDKSGRGGTFVGVNLAALPETIVESELFGHEKGSFTGASFKRQGRIAQADGGTLFLDEVGELSAAVQVKLLRVLQEGEYEPLGGKTQKADFRLIAATNRDLHAAVKEGSFREDLYYRLNVIAITCPRLRDRPEDIPLLLDHFLDVYCAKNGRAKMLVSLEAMKKLTDYEWPGNVRELENVVERAVVLSQNSTIELADLPSTIGSASPRTSTTHFRVGMTLEQMEKEAIEAALAHTGGDKQLAARLLGISARTIYRKLGDKEEAD